MDLRDHLADFEAAALRLLARMAPRPAPQPHTVAVTRPRAACHPDRPLAARTLCSSCYNVAWRSGRLHDAPDPVRAVRKRADFIADYEMLRAEGYTRRQIADRLGMNYPAVNAAYSRAIRAGALTPDRRHP